MAGKPRVYLETTFISYLTARPSRDLIQAAHQQVTLDWWEKRRADFELYVSQLVLEEVSVGDPEAVSKRRQIIAQVSLLETTREAVELARMLMRGNALPEKAVADALHIAIAAVSDMDFLLTWNHRHLANASIRKAVEEIISDQGRRQVIICTPEELMGE